MYKTLLVLLSFSFLIFPAYAQDEVTHLRFAHFSPTIAEPADLYIDGVASGQPVVGYGEFSQWFALPAGEYEITFVLGETVTEPLTLEGAAGAWKTLALTDTVTVIEENYFALPDDEARLTVFHGVEGLAPVNALLGDEVITENLEYGSSFNTAVSADGYELTFQEGEALISEEVELEAGQNMFVALVDAPNHPQIVSVASSLSEQLPPTATPTNTDTPTASPTDTPTNTHTPTETPEATATYTPTVTEPATSTPTATETPEVGNALLRFAHLSSGTPPLDFYLDGELTDFQNISFPMFDNWMPIPGGSHTLMVTLRGKREPLIDSVEIDLTEGAYFTAAVIGTQALNTLEIHVIQEDFTALPETRFRLGVLNAYPGVGPVDISYNSEVLIDELAYPGFFGDNDGFSEITLERAVYDLRLTTASGTLAELNQTHFIEGRNYMIALIDANPPFVLTFSDLGEVMEMIGD